MFMVTGPAGRKYRVTGETAEGAAMAVEQFNQSGSGETLTPELKEAARRAMAAGDHEAAKRLVDAARVAGAQQATQPQRELVGTFHDNGRIYRSADGSLHAVNASGSPSGLR